MTRPGIEPQSLAPFVNTLHTRIYSHVHTFNIVSYAYIYSINVFVYLFGFNDISTFVGYLMLNPFFYINKL